MATGVALFVFVELAVGAPDGPAALVFGLTCLLAGFGGWLVSPLPNAVGFVGPGGGPNG